MALKAILFDAYGTLLDVHSVTQNEELSALWRRKQLEYTWLRSLMGRYQNFWTVTEDALHAAAGQLKVELTAEQADALMQAYLRPKSFEDAKLALERLKGRQMAILSNGTRSMLWPALRSNGLDGYFEEILSADSVQIYKPSPKVYALGPETLGVPAREILFVSSNAWDAAGAKAFGYVVCWVNRIGSPGERLGIEPDIEVRGLDQLADAIAGV